MVNILSQVEKKKVLLEYRLRLGVTVVFVLAFLVLANIVLLAPSYILVLTKYNFITEHVTKLEKAQGGAGQEKEINDKVKELNKKVDLFNGFGKANTEPPLTTILGIIQTKDPDIKINSFLYDKTNDRERIVVSGRADTREGLATFLETIKKDPKYTKVDLPIGSYVKSTNIDFSIAIERSLKATSTPKTI